MLPTLAAAAAGLAALAWIVLLARLRSIAATLPTLQAGPAPDGAPRVSVVVAAKDEAEGIERAVRSLLAQEHPDFEVVVVDDRSADGTGAILDRLAAEFPGKLKVVHVTSLPEGWGGQNHALSRGVEAATGSWILFTDADCDFVSTRALPGAAAEAARSGAELLSVLPRLELPTWRERIVDPPCAIALLLGLGVGDPDSAYANGAFLYIRRELYARLGGHAAVRGRANDDVELARLAKAAGAEVRVLDNRGLVRTRMYGTAGESWDGWTRNFRGTLGGFPRLAFAALAAAWLGLAPAAGLAASLALGPGWGLAAAAWGGALLVAQLGAAAVYGAFGVSGFSLGCIPGSLFAAAALSRAAGRALLGRRTEWQGAKY